MRALERGECKDEREGRRGRGKKEEMRDSEGEQKGDRNGKWDKRRRKR